MKEFNLWDLMDNFADEKEKRFLLNLKDSNYKPLDNLVWSFRRDLINKLTDLMSENKK